MSERNQNKSTIWMNWNTFSEYRTVLLGCAIIGIVLCHLDLAQTHQGLEVSKLASVFHVFTAFVDVFLFLSGLGLYYSMRRNPGRRYSVFIKRRVVKIIPLYLAIGLITYTIWDVILNHGTVGQVLKDLFFVSWFASGSTRYWFVLAVLIFYAVFPLLYGYLHKGGKGLRKLCVLLVSYIAVTWLLHHCFAWYDTFKIAIERFPIFVLGVYCGRLVYEEKDIPRWLVIGISVLAIGSTILLYGSDTVSSWIYGAHYAYYFTRAILGLWMCFTILFVLEKLKVIWPVACIILERFFAYLGGITLEIYLLHQSYMIVLDFPCGGGYIFAAVVFPIITASVIYLLKKWGKARLWRG